MGVVITILALAWLAYRPALGGAFLLDDAPNLAGLNFVTDKDSALQFVLSGTSGPLGRPLALASFVPQAPMWSVSPEPFIQVNIFIHLTNGLLLYLFLIQLQHQMQRPPENLALAATFRNRLRTYAPGAIAVYLTLASFVLIGITSLWGQPQLAARYWYQHYPASVRAATTYATSQLSANSPQGAAETLREFAERQPSYANIRIPELNLACRLHPDGDHSGRINRLEEQLPSVQFSYMTSSMLVNC